MLTTPVRFHDAAVPFAKPVLRDALTEGKAGRATHVLRETVMPDTGQAASEHGAAVAPAAPKEGEAARRRRVVLLGSGLVAGPAVKQLASRVDVDLVIGKHAHKRDGGCT